MDRTTGYALPYWTYKPSETPTPHMARIDDAVDSFTEIRYSLTCELNECNYMYVVMALVIIFLKCRQRTQISVSRREKECFDRQTNMLRVLKCLQLSLWKCFEGLEYVWVNIYFIDTTQALLLSEKFCLDTDVADQHLFHMITGVYHFMVFLPREIFFVTLIV